MTRRKHPQPEADPPQDTSPAETVAGEPFVVTDPTDPPAAPDPEPEPAPVEPPPPPRIVERRGSIFPSLLGGALAAIGGFALSHFDAFGLRPAQPSAELAALTTQLAEVETQISGIGTLGSDLSALSDRVAQLEAAPAPAAPDLSRLDGLEERLAAIEAIGAALRGESEPIRQYGVLLDDATLKQRAMTLGIYDGTHDAGMPRIDP